MTEFFAEIDVLPRDFDLTVIEANVESAETVDAVAIAQDERRKRVRQFAYAKLLSCRIINIEIITFDDRNYLRDLQVESSTGLIQESVASSECYGLVEFLLSKGFKALSTGKFVRSSETRGEGNKSVTWMLLERETGI